MVELYVSQIIKGRKVFNEVPEKYKEEVRITLIERGYEHLVIE